MTGADQPHILVVDDDDRLRDLLTRYLGENGFSVSAARDAAHARASLAGLQFDLIVLDVLMPGEKGVDLARSLRESGSKVPILLLTALSETEDRIAGLEAGVDDYLAKPFEPRAGSADRGDPAPLRGTARTGRTGHRDCPIRYCMFWSLQL